MSTITDSLREIPRFIKREIWLLLTKHGQSIPDKTYLKMIYWLQMRKRLNLENPAKFSEKLQWLKLYNRKPIYTTIVDKSTAKEYAAKIIGEQYIIPTLGVWDSFDDIDFDSLPQQFVLKATQSGGGMGVVICHDKNTLDKEEARKKLDIALHHNNYVVWREWPYKNIKPRIIAEQYMEAENGSLDDYKFSCFDGRVNDVMVCFDRGSGDTKFYFFDKEWNLLPLNVRGKNASKGFTLPKPECMDEMFELAAKLSEGLPYARVDLYAVKGHPYFGEITFFPASGVDPNLLPETEKLYGSMIQLPQMSKQR